MLRAGSRRCSRPARWTSASLLGLADAGSDALENLQVTHQRCNMAKNGRRSAKLREQRLASGESERRIWEGAITLDDAHIDRAIADAVRPVPRLASSPPPQGSSPQRTRAPKS
jgi:hypothetical protein